MIKKKPSNHSLYSIIFIFVYLMHLTHSMWKINVVSTDANVSGIAGIEIYEPIQETEFIGILSKTYISKNF